LKKLSTELDSLYLLFLNNIKSIEIVNENNGNASRSIKLKRNTLKDSTLKIFSIDEGENQKEFLLFENSVSIGQKKLPIKIAFTVNRKGSKLEFEQIDSSPLFAFFATDKRTNLPFYIHAPFLTTPARDNIIENEPRNERLFSALTDLMVHAIDLLKANQLIELKTWLVFPCNISFYKNEIYKMFCDSFFRYLIQKKTLILPSDQGGFCHVNSAMKTTNREIQSLISQKEAKIFFGKTDWVTQKINNPDFKNINDWLAQQYKVPTIGYTELCEKLDDSFFKKQTDAWLLKFYGCIAEEKKLWRTGDKHNAVGALRSKAFIRTSKNKTVTLFDEQGNLSIYYPTEGTSNYQFVKNIFLDDKEARKLFKSLNLTKPDLLAEVNEHVIPRIAKTTALYRGLKEDILKIFRAIKRADYEEEKAIIQKLKNLSWLPGRNNLSKKISLYKPDEIYFPSRDLTTLLSKSPTANFLDSSLFTDNKSKQNSRVTLEDVGVYFRPRRFYKQDDDIIFENRNAPSENYWNGNDIELEGLKEYLRKPIDKKASIALWNILTKSSDGWKQSGFDTTKFIEQLKEIKWLFNKFGQRLKPSDITPSELDEAYDDSDKLMDALNFKADEIKNFELEHGGKFFSNDELQQIKDELAELKRENERLKNTYEPTADEDSENNLPDIGEIEIGNELSLDDTIPTDDIPDDHQMDDYTDSTDGNGSVVVLTNSTPTKRQKKIGVRGEEFVLKLLEENYKDNNTIEIANLNDDDKLGVGCDIIIKKNGVAEILIEVKSTEGGYDNKFKISEKQWRTAIKSHLNSDEPEYHIYCVFYAGSSTPQHLIIKDPIKWMLNKNLRFVEQWFNVRNIKR